MEDKDLEQVDTSINGLAIELLKEVKVQTKRWMIAFFTVLVLWFATIGGFVWYLNQYDFESYEVISEDGGNANYVGNDGDISNYGESGSEETNQEK